MKLWHCWNACAKTKTKALVRSGANAWQTNCSFNLSRPGSFVTGFIQNERKLSSSGSFSPWPAYNCLMRTAVKSIGWSNLGYGQSPWSDIISKYLKGTTRGQILEYGKLIRPHICHKSSRTCKFKRATRAYRLCYKHQRPYYECRYAYSKPM